MTRMNYKSRNKCGQLWKQTEITDNRKNFEEKDTFPK